VIPVIFSSAYTRYILEKKVIYLNYNSKNVIKNEEIFPIKLTHHKHSTVLRKSRISSRQRRWHICQ